VPELKFSLVDLLLMPVALPMRCTWTAIEQVAQRAHDETYDRSTLQRRLMELEWLRELEEIDEETYVETQATLMGRLEAVERTQ